MLLKYQEKLSEWNIKDLTNPDLDGKFVSKARTFESDLTKGVLSEEEISAIDDELCVLFDTLHDFEESDNNETAQLKRENLILAGKQEANNCTEQTQLTDLSEKYKDFPEVLEFIQKRAINLAKELEKAKSDQIEKDRLEQIEREKEKQNQEKNKKETEKLTLQKKLLSNTEFSYDQLREMNIEPTGEDMVVENVYLKRLFMFKVYRVMGLVEKTV